MRVLVTGATGFIGSQLTRALVDRSAEVRILRRPSSKVLGLSGLEVEQAIGDILDPVSVESAVKGCDVVFHTAAVAQYWRSSRDEIYRVNVEGTRVVMQACLRARVKRVVHTSSVAAVGIPPPGITGSEQTAFDALSAKFPYAHSKRRAEEEVQRAVGKGLAAVIVNPAVVIGPGDHNQVSGSLIVEIARRGVPAVPPGGVCVADVDAVVTGHLAASEAGRVGERYILGGENLSYSQIAGIICKVAGRQPPERLIPRSVLPYAAKLLDTFYRLTGRTPTLSGDQIRLCAYDLYYDSSKAVGELGYPLLPFRSAAEKAYDWYVANGYLN